MGLVVSLPMLDVHQIKHDILSKRGTTVAVH